MCVLALVENKCFQSSVKNLETVEGWQQEGHSNVENLLQQVPFSPKLAWKSGRYNNDDDVSELKSTAGEIIK